MGRQTKTKRTWEIRSDLQAIFLRRVKEELARQEISQNQLSKREGAPAQKTINDMLKGADPRLETVQSVADALGVPVVSLLLDTRLTSNIQKLPSYPTIGRDIPDSIGKKEGDRKKRGG
jgi:transcriptional regulator with XRE-family HTH domain